MNSPDKPPIDLAARCACGAVELRLNGRVRSMFLCSCEDCQRSTGTGHATVALVAIDDLEVAGATRSFARPAHSGATLTRWFCPVCGTPLHARSSRAEALALVPVGLFAGAAGWFAPSQLIFARSHHEWDLVDPALPRHDTYREPTA